MRTIFHLLICVLTVATTATAKTTLTWWQFWTDPDIKPTIESMVSEFEAANPEIDIELTDLTWANGQEKIVISFASNTGPDIVELGSDWIAQFASNDQLADLTLDMARDSADLEGWGLATYNDKVWAYPWILGTRVMFANRDLLRRAGYDTTFLPINWPQLKEATFKVQKLGNGIYGWGSNTAEKHRLYKKFLPFFWSGGGRFFTDDGKYCIVSAMPGIEALTFYKLLHDSCGYVGDQRTIEDAFLDGKIGFIISGDWLLKRIELEKRKINLMTSLIPGPKYPGRSFMGGEFLAVNAASKNKEAALQFIRFITSPDNQVRFCKANRSANPSSVTAQKDPYFTSDPNLQTFIKQLRAADHPPVDPNWAGIEDDLEKAIEDALFGRGLPATALRELQIKIAEQHNQQ